MLKKMTSLKDKLYGEKPEKVKKSSKKVGGKKVGKTAKKK